MIDQDETRRWARAFAERLCDVWGWEHGEPEAEALGANVAYAMHHAVGGTGTGPAALAEAILHGPQALEPARVYARALADVRAALIAADPSVSDETLHAIDLPNPYPENS